MPNIKPVSDLRNYNSVLSEVTYGSPVYLTKNGRGDCAIISMQELDELRAIKALFSELEKGEKSAREQGFMSLAESRKKLDIYIDIKKFWGAVLRQNAEEIRQYFKPTAYIKWHCTNEQFNVEEFIQVNCEYPGKWDGTVERIEQIGNLIVTVTKVFSKNEKLSFHVVSFIRIEDDKITAIDEYWGDDGAAPSWRSEKHIGTSIL